jgi:tRNA(fMet)-specific endonuclease VapC
MEVVLLDTNIVSFLLKGDTRARDYTPLLHGKRLSISFMTVAELFEWAATRNWGAARIQQLERTLATYIIIPVDIDCCRR